MLTWVWYFDQAYYFNIFCKIKYSNDIYRPNNLMLQTKSQGHRKILKCFTIYGHGGHCKVGLCQPRVEPTFPMLHTMSPTHWLIFFYLRDDLKGLYTLDGRGSHLGHVTINKWRFWSSYTCSDMLFQISWTQYVTNVFLQTIAARRW